MRDWSKLIRRQFQALSQKANVVGVGQGYKLVRGRRTSEPALVVLVEKKLPPKDLSRSDLLPQSVGDTATDVIEIGHVRLLGRTDRMRPAPGGVSIGHYLSTAGTLGAVVRDRHTGEVLILSNNHVLANATSGADGKAKEGDAIYQPGPYDGGTQEDLIGHLTRFVPIRREYGASNCPKAARLESLGNRVLKLIRPNYRLSLTRLEATENRVDCAAATPLQPELVSPEILELGPVRGTAPVEVGDRVQKSGRTSGVNQATVQVLNTTLRVSLGEGDDAIFAGQIVAGPMAQPGDSGSLVLDLNNRAVGLLFAGSDQSTIINPIQNVLNALEVDLLI